MKSQKKREHGWISGRGGDRDKEIKEKERRL